MIDNTEFISKLKYGSFSTAAKERKSSLQWKVIDELSGKFSLVHHTGKCVGNFIYLHGGIHDLIPNKPVNNFYQIDVSNNSIKELTTDYSPKLSQHASVVISNRYFVLIGGWNGHSRIYHVFVYDTVENKWLPKPEVTGFHEKAGLSGHTANYCIKGKNELNEIIVIGREGGIRTQRRYGNIFRLRYTSDLKKFTYSDIEIHMDSRSNHSTCVLNSKLYIVGGRDDRVIDIHKLPNLINSTRSKVVDKFISNIDKYKLEKCPLTGHRKAGRRGHCLITGNKGFVLCGGESFMISNGIADQAGFVYIIIDNKEQYYFLGSFDICRTNGLHILDDNGEAYYHGGIDHLGNLCSDFLILKEIS